MRRPLVLFSSMVGQVEKIRPVDKTLSQIYSFVTCQWDQLMVLVLPLKQMSTLVLIGTSSFTSYIVFDPVHDPVLARPGVDAVHDWACLSYGRQDDGVLIEAERVVVGAAAAVVTPSPSPAPY